MLLQDIRDIAIAAGAEAMRFYGQPFTVDYKADDSPLTAADRAAHNIICSRLLELTPDIPVLSEESEPDEIAERRSWSRFWLVDPLDGTKEFIKQTGEFTVNIALIVDGKAELGVIHAPATGLTYFAEKGSGAFKQQGDQPAEAIHTRPSPLRTSEDERQKTRDTRPAAGRGAEGGSRKTEDRRLETRDRPQAAGSTLNEEPGTENQEPTTLPVLTIVASRDHAGPLVERLFQRYPEAETRSMGSSLKFCLVAEGKADIYLRDVPTMEWDTAAAQCILETAGGQIRELNGPILSYNKESLRNPSIVAVGDAEENYEL